MRMLAVAARTGTCVVARSRVAPILLLLTLAFSASTAAQSFLGTVRGTVVDPQGADVPGADALLNGTRRGEPPRS